MDRRDGLRPAVRLLRSDAVQTRCRPSPSHLAGPLPRRELADSPERVGRETGLWAEAFSRGVLRLLGVVPFVPDHSTSSRRGLSLRGIA